MPAIQPGRLIKLPALSLPLKPAAPCKLMAAQCIRRVGEQPVTEETFNNLSMTLGIAALIGFMLFIVWDLAKQSKAGKLGTAILFLVLGLCLAAFLIKAILVETIG